MIENIRLSFKGIFSHKMRSFLTMLGIIIGIGSIIAIMSIINGVSVMMKDKMLGSSDSSISIISIFNSSEGWSEAYDVGTSGVLEGVSDISEKTIKDIKQVRGVVDAIALYTAEYVDIFYDGNSTNTNLYGVKSEYFSMSDAYLLSGRLLTKSDYENRNNVVVIDKKTAYTLFKGTDCIGKSITIGNGIMVIVGVVDVPHNYDNIETITDYYIEQINSPSVIYVPSTVWSEVRFYDDIQSVALKVDDSEDSVQVSMKVADILNRTLSMTDGYTYKPNSWLEALQEIETITTVVSILFSGIASISLLVGGIGVMNIMLVSVTERTREIGLKKALGAKRSQILLQFLTEAMVLTGIGGIFGVLFGGLLGQIIGLIFGMTISISLFSVVVSVAFSMAVGIIFGIVPSINASKLDPIVALRYE